MFDIEVSGCLHALSRLLDSFRLMSPYMCMLDESIMGPVWWLQHWHPDTDMPQQRTQVLLHAQGYVDVKLYGSVSSQQQPTALSFVMYAVHWWSVKDCVCTIGQVHTFSNHKDGARWLCPYTYAIVAGSVLAPEHAIGFIPACLTDCIQPVFVCNSHVC